MSLPHKTKKVLDLKRRAAAGHTSSTFPLRITHRQGPRAVAAAFVGRDNPANTVNRGASVDHLLQNKLWWLGQDWVCSEQGLYYHYSTKDILTERDIVECEKTKTVVFSTITGSNWIGNTQVFFLSKTIAGSSQVSTVCQNLRTLPLVQTNFFYAAELNQAHSIIIVHTQREMFSEEIQTLERIHQVSSQSKLIILHPFLDDEKILRVGGRLRNVNLPEKNKASNYSS
ncbi:hypothetical protein TNCV_1519331 [Trichonephila clavipes]|nr:hypothetical protein TNCV_1519331 [Trichonephila clavipes]